MPRMMSTCLCSCTSAVRGPWRSDSSLLLIPTSGLSTCPSGCGEPGSKRRPRPPFLRLRPSLCLR
eukprot:8207176-Alexandrium_andersonii.AAC.1